MSIQDTVAEAGFTEVGTCPVEALSIHPEVRDMCASGTCQAYDSNWSCPPACGGIEIFEKLIGEHETCYVVQTWGELEDQFDYETMMELQSLHKERMCKLAKLAGERIPEALVLSAGSCDVCPECTYPNEPCTHPEQMLVSMEAAGLIVAEVCDAAGVPYNRGANTMTYVGCVLL